MDLTKRAHQRLHAGNYENYYPRSSNKLSKTLQVITINQSPLKLTKDQPFSTLFWPPRSYSNTKIFQDNNTK